MASFICDTPISLISLVDNERQWFKSKIGLDVPETDRSRSFCAHILDDGQTLIVEDTLSGDRFSGNPLVVGEPGIRFYAGARLISRNGHILGSLCVIDTKPRSFPPQHLKALEALSRQVMVIFEARLTLIEAEKASAALMQSEKLAGVGRMACSMAHEINNPLEAITNLLSLRRQRAIIPEVKPWLHSAKVELRRISIIANQTFRSREATDPRTGRKGLALTIADTGCGMDHETQGRMFEAFFTTKGIAGGGLGLW